MVQVIASDYVSLVGIPFWLILHFDCGDTGILYCHRRWQMLNVGERDAKLVSK